MKKTICLLFFISFFCISEADMEYGRVLLQ